MNTKTAKQISIRQLPTGAYTAQFTIDGKRFNFYGKTKTEVRQKLEDAEKERTAAANKHITNYADKRTATVEEWFEIWLRDYVAPSVRSSTYNGYQGMIRNHVNPQIGSKKLAALDPQLLQQFFNGLQKKLSAKTITNMRNMLHSSFSSACSSGYLLYSPLQGIRLPKAFKPKMRVLNADEQQRLVETVKSADQPCAFSFLFALFTGLRRGEILGLRWCDIDLKQQIVSVRHSLDETKDIGKTSYEVRLSPPKSQSAVRTIYLFDALAKDLHKHMDAQKQLKKACGFSFRKTDYVFEGKHFGYIRPRQYAKYFNTICQKAALKNVTIHTLRHTFATRALETGMDIVTLSRLMGHSEPGFTMREYIHVLNDHKKENMERLSDLYKQS